MRDAEALGRDHVALQIGRRETGGARSDDDVRRRMLADLGEHALLQRQLFRDVLLNEVRLLRHYAQIRGKRQLAFGRQRREGQPRQGGFGVGDRAADPFFHFGLNVRRDNVDSKMQCPCGPSAADDAGSKKPQCFHFPHDCLPRIRRALCNVTSII